GSAPPNGQVRGRWPDPLPVGTRPRDGAWLSALQLLPTLSLPRRPGAALARLPLRRLREAAHARRAAGFGPGHVPARTAFVRRGGSHRRGRVLCLGALPRDRRVRTRLPQRGYGAGPGPFRLLGGARAARGA